MNTYKVSELENNSYCSRDVVLDRAFLLLTNSIPVTESLKKALEEWEFTEVYSEGHFGKEYEDNAVKPPPSFDELDIAIDKAMASNGEHGSIDTSGSDSNRLSAVRTIYNEYLAYINSLYTRYATHKELDYNKISAAITEFCVFVRENRRYVLRIQPNTDPNSKNFLIGHSMRSTVLAITIGLQMKLPLSKLQELGVASVLHEIGMIKLPPQLYITDRKLTPNEKNTINTHPLISYNILKSYEFPLSICLGVLEHHEKENGQGYPRRLNGSQISMYAKIIAVACTFEAITAPRKYKTAQSTHMAMVEMLKNTGHQYDEVAIKALLYSLSLFPIGAYVYLTNNKIAQVTDVNPENPKNPIVQIINEKEANGDPVTIQTSDTGVRIIRVLDKKEADDIIKQMELI